jgi:hypothetical protein
MYSVFVVIILVDLFRFLTDSMIKESSGDSIVLKWKISWLEGLLLLISLLFLVFQMLFLLSINGVIFFHI